MEYSGASIAVLVALLVLLVALIAIASKQRQNMLADPTPRRRTAPITVIERAPTPTSAGDIGPAPAPPAGSSAGWARPDQQRRPRRATSSGQVALGVFLGLWAFAISAGVVVLGVLALWERSP